MDNERLESALDWCKKNKIKNTKQLSLFAKLKKRKKKKKGIDNVDNKDNRILRGGRQNKKSL